jgi:hypothetical protein
VNGRYLACRVLLAAGLFAAGANALALPMASEGRWMLMADAEPDLRGVALNHAVTRQDAFGVAAARQTSMKSSGMEHKRDWAAASYTRLVHRWNLPHAQANLWFVGLVGSARVHEAGPDNLGLWSPAVLADYETTRVYVGGGLQTLQTNRWQRHAAYLRTGFSFYEADYEETQPWLIVETKREYDGVEGRQAVTKSTVTPLLRLINRRWFVDVGGNRDGLRVNFMWIP